MCTPKKLKFPVVCSLLRVVDSGPFISIKIENSATKLPNEGLLCRFGIKDDRKADLGISGILEMTGI
jgi:hypothetical protein